MPPLEPLIPPVPSGTAAKRAAVGSPVVLVEALKFSCARTAKQPFQCRPVQTEYRDEESMRINVHSHTQGMFLDARKAQKRSNVVLAKLLSIISSFLGECKLLDPYFPAKFMNDTEIVIQKLARFFPA